jgi:RimJ/RimL family protein N-acetyltransferase
MAATTTFRKLGADEAPLLARHLWRLGSEDWRARFHGQVARERAAEHAQRLDWTRAVVIGGFCDGELRAVGELHPAVADGACEAEIAITVETGWQNRGIGTELLRRLINAARNRNLRRVCLLCLAENARIRHLVEKLEGSLHGDLDQVEGSIAPLPPTFATLLEEGGEDGEALLARLRQLSRSRAA